MVNILDKSAMWVFGTAVLKMTGKLKGLVESKTNSSFMNIGKTDIVKQKISNWSEVKGNRYQDVTNSIINN